MQLIYLISKIIFIFVSDLKISEKLENEIFLFRDLGKFCIEYVVNSIFILLCFNQFIFRIYINFIFIS